MFRSCMYVLISCVLLSAAFADSTATHTRLFQTQQTTNPNTSPLPGHSAVLPVFQRPTYDNALTTVPQDAINKRYDEIKTRCAQENKAETDCKAEAESEAKEVEARVADMKKDLQAMGQTVDDKATAMLRHQVTTSFEADRTKMMDQQKRYDAVQVDATQLAARSADLKASSGCTDVTDCNKKAEMEIKLKAAFRKEFEDNMKSAGESVTTPEAKEKLDRLAAMRFTGEMKRQEQAQSGVAPPKAMRHKAFTANRDSRIMEEKKRLMAEKGFDESKAQAEAQKRTEQMERRAAKFASDDSRSRLDSEQQEYLARKDIDKINKRIAELPATQTSGKTEDEIRAIAEQAVDQAEEADKTERITKLRLRFPMKSDDDVRKMALEDQAGRPDTKGFGFRTSVPHFAQVARPEPRKLQAGKKLDNPVTLETKTTIRTTDDKEPIAQGEALAAEKCKHLGESSDFCTFRFEHVKSPAKFNPTNSMDKEVAIVVSAGPVDASKKEAFEQKVKDGVFQKAAKEVDPSATVATVVEKKVMTASANAQCMYPAKRHEKATTWFRTKDGEDMNEEDMKKKYPNSLPDGVTARTSCPSSHPAEPAEEAKYTECVKTAVDPNNSQFVANWVREMGTCGKIVAVTPTGVPAPKLTRGFEDGDKADEENRREAVKGSIERLDNPKRVTMEIDITTTKGNMPSAEAAVARDAMCKHIGADPKNFRYTFGKRTPVTGKFHASAAGTPEKEKQTVSINGVTSGDAADKTQHDTTNMQNAIKTSVYGNTAQQQDMTFKAPTAPTAVPPSTTSGCPVPQVSQDTQQGFQTIAPGATQGVAIQSGAVMKNGDVLSATCKDGNRNEGVSTATCVVVDPQYPTITGQTGNCIPNTASTTTTTPAGTKSDNSAATDNSELFVPNRPPLVGYKALKTQFKFIVKKMTSDDLIKKGLKELFGEFGDRLEILSFARTDIQAKMHTLQDLTALKANADKARADAQTIKTQMEKPQQVTVDVNAPKVPDAMVTQLTQNKANLAQQSTTLTKAGIQASIPGNIDTKEVTENCQIGQVDGMVRANVLVTGKVTPVPDTNRVVKKGMKVAFECGQGKGPIAAESECVDGAVVPPPRCSRKLMFGKADTEGCKMHQRTASRTTAMGTDCQSEQDMMAKAKCFMMTVVNMHLDACDSDAIKATCTGMKDKIEKFSTEEQAKVMSACMKAPTLVHVKRQLNVVVGNGDAEYNAITKECSLTEQGERKVCQVAAGAVNAISEDCNIEQVTCGATAGKFHTTTVPKDVNVQTTTTTADTYASPDALNTKTSSNGIDMQPATKQASTGCALSDNTLKFNGISVETQPLINEGQVTPGTKFALGCDDKRGFYPTSTTAVENECVVSGSGSYMWLHDFKTICEKKVKDTTPKPTCDLTVMQTTAPARNAQEFVCTDGPPNFNDCHFACKPDHEYQGKDKLTGPCADLMMETTKRMCTPKHGTMTCRPFFAKGQDGKCGFRPKCKTDCFKAGTKECSADGKCVCKDQMEGGEKDPMCRMKKGGKCVNMACGKAAVKCEEPEKDGEAAKCTCAPGVRGAKCDESVGILRKASIKGNDEKCTKAVEMIKEKCADFLESNGEWKENIDGSKACAKDGCMMMLNRAAGKIREACGTDAPRILKAQLLCVRPQGGNEGDCAAEFKDFNNQHMDMEMPTGLDKIDNPHLNKMCNKCNRAFIRSYGELLTGRDATNDDAKQVKQYLRFREMMCTKDASGEFAFPPFFTKFMSIESELRVDSLAAFKDEKTVSDLCDKSGHAQMIMRINSMRQESNNPFGAMFADKSESDAFEVPSKYPKWMAQWDEKRAVICARDASHTTAKVGVQQTKSTFAIVNAMKEVETTYENNEMKVKCVASTTTSCGGATVRDVAELIDYKTEGCPAVDKKCVTKDRKEFTKDLAIKGLKYEADSDKRKKVEEALRNDLAKGLALTRDQFPSLKLKTPTTASKFSTQEDVFNTDSTTAILTLNADDAGSQNALSTNIDKQWDVNGQPLMEETATTTGDPTGATSSASTSNPTSNPGTPGVPTAPVPPSATPSAEDEGGSNMLFVIIGVVVGLVVLGLIVGVCIMMKKKKNSSAHKQLESPKANPFDEQWGYDEGEAYDSYYGTEGWEGGYTQGEGGSGYGGGYDGYDQGYY